MKLTGLNKRKITIAYTGALVDDGTMDVSDLGPALIALGKLVNSSNEVLNNDNSSIAVKVNADFQKGSFEITFECIRTFVDQVASLFTGTTDIDNILKYLGLANTLGMPTLADLIKWAYKKTIVRATNNSDGTVTLTDESQTSITVHANVVNIYQSPKVRESYAELVNPVKREGIDSFEVRDYSEKERIVVRNIDKDDVDSFEFDIATAESKERELVQASDQWVKLLKVDFENLKWRLQSGENKYYATIADEEFSNHVANGDISFTNGDSLLVRLEQTQTIKSDGTIRNEYRILKVLEIQKRPKPIPLPFDTLN